MQSSREERKAVNLGSVPLGGDPEEKDCLSGDMPQETLMVQVTHWVPQS